jgi:flagellar protein FliJ
LCDDHVNVVPAFGLYQQMGTVPFFLPDTMTKFHFRLATLLRLRQTARDERRLQLGAAQQAEAELQHQRRRLRQQQQRLDDQRRQVAQPGVVDVARLVEAEQYAASLRIQAAELDRRRRELADEIERRRLALVEADRDVRTLEKLRENQYQIHRQDENRQDAKRLDDAALQTANR